MLTETEQVFADFFFSTAEHAAEARDWATSCGDDYIRLGNYLACTASDHARYDCKPGLAWRMFQLARDRSDWSSIARHVSDNLREE